MATLQQRGNSFRVLFVWHGKRCAFTIGKVEPSEADAKLAQAEYLLMRLKQRLLTLPPGCDVETFLRFDGHPPASNDNGSPQARPQWFLGDFHRSTTWPATRRPWRSLDGVRHQGTFQAPQADLWRPVSGLAEFTSGGVAKACRPACQRSLSQKTDRSRYDFQGDRLPPHGLELGSPHGLPVGPIPQPRGYDSPKQTKSPPS